MTATAFITDAELAEQLTVPREFVLAQCRAKKWPHSRIGRRYRFTPEDVAAIAELTHVAPSREAASSASWGRRGRSA